MKPIEVIREEKSIDTEDQADFVLYDTTVVHKRQSANLGPGDYEPNYDAVKERPKGFVIQEKTQAPEKMK